MPLIRNIVLDMGNVLMDYDPEVPLKKFLDSEADRAVIRKELFEGPEWVLRDAGTISENEMYERVAARVPERLHEGLRHCAYEWMICMVPLEAARKFCAYAREQGYRLYVLSNASDTFYGYFEDFTPLTYFDGVVISCEVHSVKPDAGIYNYLLEHYQLNPKECLFLDDREDNVQGARAVGMQAEVYKNNFEQIIEQYHLGRR